MTLLTFVATSKAEQRDGTYDAEYVVREDGQHLAQLGVRLEEGEARPGRGNDLLFLRARELPEQCLCNCRWRLDGQRVEEHVGSRRHDCGEGADSLRGFNGRMEAVQNGLLCWSQKLVMLVWFSMFWL